MEALKKIENTILIEAFPDVVWKFLTKPEFMKHWMGEKEMGIEVSTNWKIGNPISISGFHHIKFENRGTVLDFEPQKKLSYTHLSSLSLLSDVKAHYSIITFLLKKINDKTELTLQLENFPTEAIYKHLNFYWRGTLMQLKSFIESQPNSI